ncbi:MAG: DUF4255 domain-containing protein [Actinobacteria bacterium]|nr:DUF4255 domain-containing protein [Actinomycetota bacterium]
MSNDIAIAAVTEAFSLLVESSAQTAVSGAEVKNGPPEAPPNSDPTRVFVYLYHVSESPHFRANDLPTRNGEGSILTKPRIGLDLNYLVSFYGAADKLEPELMLGSVVSTIHARPILSPTLIQEAISRALVGDPLSALADSDLAQQVEGVRITPVSLDLEEMSKLWSVFFQEPYTLSVAYRVSIVLIEVDETPLEGLPVQVRHVQVFPSVAPFITGVSPAAVAHSSAGALLTLTGTSLAADRVVVKLGDSLAAPQSVTNQKIVVLVPSTLPAGVRAVYVAHMAEWGTADAPDPRPIMESNRVAFAYQPEIVAPPNAIAAPGPLVLTVNPEVQKGQQVGLLLRETAESADGTAPRSFEANQTMTTTSHRVSIDLTGAPKAEFWLRIAVDEVTSALQFDETGFTGPKLVIS